MLQKILFWLAVAVIFVAPWENGAKIEGFGSLTKALGLVLGAAWLGMIIIQGKIRLPHPFHLLILIFFLWNFLTLLWTDSLALTTVRVMTYAQLVLLSWLLWNLVTTEKKLRITLQAYVLGAYISVYNLLVNYFDDIDFRDTGRFTAFDFNPNELATLLTIAIPIAWYLAVSGSITTDKKNRILTYANYFFIAPATFAILLTGSRNALFSLIPAFWFVLGATTQLKIVPKVLIMVVLIGGLTSVQGLLPKHTITRLQSTDDEITQGDLQGRQQIWEQGMEQFWEHPLTGVGTGAYEAAIERGKVAHNTYYSILVESGLPGFLFFLLILIMLIYLAARQPLLIASLWLTVLVLWGLGVTSKTWEHRKPTWLIFNWIVISSSFALADDARSKRNKEDSPDGFLEGAVPLPPLMPQTPEMHSFQKGYLKNNPKNLAVNYARPSNQAHRASFPKGVTHHKL